VIGRAPGRPVVDGVEPIAPATGSFDYTVGFYPLIAIRAPSKIQSVDADGAAHFRLDVQNRGNAATTVTLLLNGSAGDWTIDVPGPVSVEAGRNTTVEVIARNSPGKDDRSFVVTATSAATADPGLAGNALNLSLLARDPGSGLLSPAPMAPLVALLLLGAALVARRRTL
jgi:hypothetical protein